MKNKILISSLALALSSTAFALTAVTTITDNTNYLLAGWDFDNTITWNEANSGARYSDIYGDNNSASTTLPVGRVYFQGTNGSDTWGTNLARSSTGQVNQQLLTRGTTPTDFIGARTGGEGSLSFNNVVEGTQDAIVFRVMNGVVAPGTVNGTLNGFDNLNIRFQARVNGADLTVLNPYSISWAYSFDGSAFISTGVTTAIDTSVNSVFTSYTADFSAVSGLASNGFASIWFQADISKGGASVTRSVNIDNVAVYGTADITPIPEPSTYAAFAGAAGLALAAFRRRRSA